MSSRTLHRSGVSAESRSASIPLTLVTGFLGSGKSSFINSAIRSAPQTRFGVLVNEFGDIGIESEIIQTHEDDVIELEGGCMCCRLRGDLIDALRTLLTHSDAIDHILVEASGLSDPLPVANTFHSNNLESRVHFDAMVCTIDAIHFESTYTNYTLAVRQLNYASFLVITKAGAKPSAELDALRRTLAAMAPQARVGVLGADVSAEEVIGTGSRIDAIEAALASGEEPARTELGGHTTLSALTVLLCTNAELTSKDAIDGALSTLGSQLVRAKGRIYVSTPEGPHVYYIVQGVAGSREFYPCPRGSRREPLSSLLLIGSGREGMQLPPPLCDWDTREIALESE